MPRLTINLKKYPRQIQHPVINLKMELQIKIVNGFRKKLHFRYVTGSEFAPDCNK